MTRAYWEFSVWEKPQVSRKCLPAHWYRGYSASFAVDRRHLILSPIHAEDFKQNGIHGSLLDTQHRMDGMKKKPAGWLVGSFGYALNCISPFYMAETRKATKKLYFLGVSKQIWAIIDWSKQKSKISPTQFPPTNVWGWQKRWCLWPRGSSLLDSQLFN